MKKNIFCVTKKKLRNTCLLKRRIPDRFFLAGLTTGLVDFLLFLFPNQQLVIGWHRVVCHQGQSCLFSQSINHFKIPDRAYWITLLQPQFEAGIAFTGVLARVFEWAINTKKAAGLQDQACPVKKICQLFLRHNMQSIGTENTAYFFYRPGLLTNIQY